MNMAVMKQLKERFDKEYGFIYEAESQGCYVVGYDEALAFGDELIDSRSDLVSDFAAYRGDFLTSDREVAAFGFAVAEVLG